MRDRASDSGRPDRAFPGAFEREVAAVSAACTEHAGDAVDHKLDRVIGRIASFFDLDRATVGQRPAPGEPLSISHQWVREGCLPIDPLIDTEIPWLRGRLAAGETVVFSSPDDLPAEAWREQEFFRRIGTRSNVTMPLVVGGEVVGWLAFGALRQARAWSPDALDQMRVLGQIVAGAISRKQAERALRRSVEFEELLANLSTSFVNVQMDAIDAHVVAAVGRVAQFLGADRANVVRRVPAERRLMRTHAWVRDGVSRVPTSEAEEAFPWLLARLIGDRALVAVSRLDELPPEAAHDRLTLERLGVRSGAVVPMVVDDEVVGFLAFSCVRRAQSWGDRETTRLRLVGEIVARALARQEAERERRRALADTERLREAAEAENVYLREAIVDTRGLGEIVGQSPAIQLVLERVRQVAGTDTPVLLLGETGTGKELVARAIHARSGRRGPLIAVNCSALPATLIESELFGHERGAFTGATHARPGRFELADGGTLFLDEIGDLEPALQAKLLRVLEEGEIQRLGATGARKVDVRVIAATNRDLARAMEDGRFRADLYYRLAVFAIELAPLRDRPEDIPILAWHIVHARQRSLGRDIKKIGRAAMDALVAHPWPGNVRELQNVIERALILSPGSALRIDEAFPPAGRASGHLRGPAAERLSDVERHHILQVVERCHWKIEGPGLAADRLGLRPSTLRHRMKKLGIRRPAP